MSDPADPNDTFLSQLMAMAASFENRKRTEIMSQARKTKAKQGMVVSALPVGWIKRSEGGYDFDPETAPIIRTVIETLWQTRSVRKTARALSNLGRD